MHVRLTRIARFSVSPLSAADSNPEISARTRSSAEEMGANSRNLARPFRGLLISRRNKEDHVSNRSLTLALNPFVNAHPLDGAVFGKACEFDGQVKRHPGL